MWFVEMGYEAFGVDNDIGIGRAVCGEEAIRVDEV